MLIARIYEVVPLTCPQCGAPMRLIALVTEREPVASISRHIGEPTEPPKLAPARVPPLWEKAVELVLGCASLAQPEPAYVFDQRISW